MPVKYVKMIKDGSWENIQEDRVTRFLEEGWSLYQPETKKGSPRKNSTKDKIVVDAQVTSETSEEETTEDWNPNIEEWADSEESFSVDESDETANKEE